MNSKELKQIISDCCNYIVFSYEGKQSGVTSKVENYVPTFQAWHGSNTKSYKDVDELMGDKIYSGKALNDLVDIVEIDVA